MTPNSPAPPQQPNRPEGLREILQPYHDHNCHSRQHWIKGMTEAFPCDCSIQDVIAAIRTRIERAIPEKMDVTYPTNSYAEGRRNGYNVAIEEFKSNIQRELGI